MKGDKFLEPLNDHQLLKKDSKRNVSIFPRAFRLSAMLRDLGWNTLYYDALSSYVTYKFKFTKVFLCACSLKCP